MPCHQARTRPTPIRSAAALLQTDHVSGRFAPSPTGDLHVGNLRTALVAWLSARARGTGFIVRMEDLDRDNASPAVEQRQLGDLAALGLDWDGPVIRQSERFDRYDEVIRTLVDDGAVLPLLLHPPRDSRGEPGTPR